MKKQADLTARYTVGDIVVTSLFDGTLQHEAADDLRGIAPEALPGALHAASLTNDLAFTVNAFLVRDGNRLILIDAGCGHDLGPGKGFVADALAETGVQPDEIELVLLTHMHPDHIGGLLNQDGAARLRRARVLAPSTDTAVFLHEGIAAGMPDASKFVFAKARAVAAAYADRFEVFEGSPEVAPGITAVALPGHSPGHTGYRLRSGRDSLPIWGDIVHCPALQFSHPEAGMVFDADPALTDRTRLDAFTTATASGEPVAGMHMVSPGFARVIKKRRGLPVRIDLGSMTSTCAAGSHGA